MYNINHALLVVRELHFSLYLDAKFIGTDLNGGSTGLEPLKFFVMCLVIAICSLDF